MCGQHANDMDNVHLCRQCLETKLYMIGYIKSTRDDIWMTLALSVRKNISRTTANNVCIIRICPDNVWMTCTYADNM